MKHTNSLFAVVLSVAATAAVTAPAHALLTARSVPPESFLDYHVDTASQLTFEVTYDKAVRGRLARHFHLSGPAMSAYVHDDLVLQHLHSPLRTRVYCVTPQGREHYVMMTLKPGTPVFALRRTGQPILRLVCGNPLVSALPPAPKKALAAKPLVKPAARTLVDAARASQGSPVLTTVGATPAAWSVPSVLTSGSGATFFTQGASGSGWLALLPAAGLAGVLSTHHGSNGGGGQGVTPTPVPPLTPATPLIPSVPVSPTGGVPVVPVPTGSTPTTPDGPAPVPEPSPALVFALGSLALGALRLRRK